jgi:hypothetical protein
VPTDGALGKKDAILSTLKSHMPSDVVTKLLKVPELKVGTLDSLMALSDDLERVDRYLLLYIYREENLFSVSAQCMCPQTHRVT